jgi:uncharacterized membrane protein
MSAWGFFQWFWLVVTVMGVVALVFKLIVIPIIDARDRERRDREMIKANHALHERLKDAMWADPGEAAKVLHSHWDEITKRGPR